MIVFLVSTLKGVMYLQLVAQVVYYCTSQWAPLQYFFSTCEYVPYIPRQRRPVIATPSTPAPASSQGLRLPVPNSSSRPSGPPHRPMHAKDALMKPVEKNEDVKRKDTDVSRIREKHAQKRRGRLNATTRSFIRDSRVQEHERKKDKESVRQGGGASLVGRDGSGSHVHSSCTCTFSLRSLHRTELVYSM